MWARNHNTSIKQLHWSIEFKINSGFDTGVLAQQHTKKYPGEHDAFRVGCSLHWKVQEGESWLIMNQTATPTLTSGLIQSGFFRCQSLVVLYRAHPALTRSRAAESAGYVPVSTAPHARRAPPGWIDPAWSGSAPSHEHMMTELQHTDTGYCHGQVSAGLVQFSDFSINMPRRKLWN